jgi:hypothetical protein
MVSRGCGPFVSFPRAAWVSFGLMGRLFHLLKKHWLGIKYSPESNGRDEDLAPFAVGFGETALREKLRKARAKRDPEAKVWLVQYRNIRGTELEATIPAEFQHGSRKK